MRSVELEDILGYKYLSNPEFAPDGSKAAFTVTCANKDDNSYEQNLWLYKDGNVRQLTSLGKEGRFIWSSDDRILFPAARSSSEKKRAEKKEQFTSFYELDLTGGEALFAFELPFAVSGIKKVTDDLYALTATVDVRYPDLYNSSDKEKEEYMRSVEEDKDYEVFDEIPFWFNGGGVTNGKRERLFAYNRKTGEIIPLTDGICDLFAFSVHNEKIYYAYTDRPAKVKMFGFNIDEYDTATCETRNVLINNDLSFAGFEWLSDDLIIFASKCRRYGLNENTWVYKADITKGRLEVIRCEEYSMYGSVGSDVRYGGGKHIAEYDGHLYHLTTREGDSVLYRLDKKGADEPVITKTGSIDSFDICNGTVLMVALYDMRPQELYTADLATGKISKISSFNDEMTNDRYIAVPEPLYIKSGETDITGWVLKPKDYDPEKTYPAVFDIHGGPKTVYGEVFYHEMQLWAGMGYFVFFCNPTGSDGRDNKFMDIRGKYGTVDYDNLMDFCDAVLEKYPQIDKNRICETGGSYGGFMTNWIIGHTDRFCCAASQRSISNWLSFWGNSDIGFYFASDQNAADLYETPEKLWDRSPLKYVKSAKTPTLFIHSDEDYRCPLEQGLQMYTSLVENGVESRFCLFHGENHELSRSGKPRHRIRRLKEITDWFEEHSAK